MLVNSICALWKAFKKELVPKKASIVRCAPQETYLAPEKSASQMKSTTLLQAPSLKACISFAGISS